MAPLTRPLRRAAVAALLLLAAALSPVAGCGTARATDVRTPVVSGLPWRSGASEEAGFGDWRGRPLDARVVFVPEDGTWAEMLSFLRNGYFREKPAQRVLS